MGVLQLPFAFYELIYIVPIRERIPGLVPVDAVAGTFGTSCTGGGVNAGMAVFLIIVLGFLIARHRARLLWSGAGYCFWVS